MICAFYMWVVGVLWTGLTINSLFVSFCFVWYVSFFVCLFCWFDFVAICFDRFVCLLNSIDNIDIMFGFLIHGVIVWFVNLGVLIIEFWCVFYGAHDVTILMTLTGRKVWDLSKLSWIEVWSLLTFFFKVLDLFRYHCCFLLRFFGITLVCVALEIVEVLVLY